MPTPHPHRSAPGYPAEERALPAAAVPAAVGSHYIRRSAGGGGEVRAAAEIIDLLYTQSVSGVFFMTADEPFEWSEAVDKQQVLEHCFAHMRVTHANRAVIRQYRARHEDFIGLTPYAFFKHDLEQGYRVWREFFDRGELHVETEERRFDGTAIWVDGHYTCLYTKDGRVDGLFGVQNNVTKRKENEVEINRARQRLESVVKTQQEMICRFLPDTTLTFVNEAYCRLFGKSPQELIGRPFLDFVPREEHEAILRSLATLGPGNPTQTYLHQSIAKDGARVWQEWTDSVILDDAGRVSELQATGRDITKQKDFENQLRHANEGLRKATQEARALARRADEANRAKGTFLATMSHEIRTPLNAIIGMGSLLLETGLDTQRSDFVQTIVKSGETLLRVINDILDYSKIETGRLELESEVFRTMDIVDNSLGMIAATARRSGVELTHYIDPATPAEFVGDSTRLQQVITNLLSNAARFTPAGEIHVSVTARPRNDNALWDLHCAVSDTGSGLDRETLRHLFQPFTQGGDPDTRKSGGAGLGLAICKHIVGHMGGTIGVESEPGKGSTFRFHVPLAPERPDYKVYVRHHSAPYEGARLLIVDDNANVRRLLTTLAAVLGMRPTAVAAPEDALRAASSGEAYDIALIDHDLAGLDGAALARGIRDCGARFPLILLTRSIPPHDARAADGLFAGIHAKPVRTGHLSNTMREVLEGGNSGR
ncbi:MAG: PAS domain S-box protein [Opitutales bacterium]|nr:PAS domain S-box protein [Opitutales bacterium]